MRLPPLHANGGAEEASGQRQRPSQEAAVLSRPFVQEVPSGSGGPAVVLAKVQDEEARGNLDSRDCAPSLR